MQQVENIAPLTSEENSECNSASNHSSDFIDSLHKKREFSKKGSDTQVSSLPGIKMCVPFFPNFYSLI